MGQLSIGTPVDNPVSDAVLVTSQVVTTPRQYVVRLVIAAEINWWVAMTHRAQSGNARTTMLIPVTGPLLGPANIYETYFHNGDYVEVAVRTGADVTGTVQATVELL